MKIIHCRNYFELSKKTSNYVIRILKNILKNKSEAIIGVSGGSSFVDTYEVLGKSNLIDWDKVHIFFIDERQVSLKSDLSNYKHFIKLFGKKKNIYPYYINRGVEDYNKIFDGVTRRKRIFDLVLLGAGEDGHVASLFPNHDLMDLRGKKYVEINDSPKLPKRRITVTRKVIEESENAILLFASYNKKKVYQKFNDKNVSAKECPAKIVKKVKNLIILTIF